MSTQTPLHTTAPSTEPDPRLWLGVVVPTAGVIVGCLSLVLGWIGSLPTATAQQWDWNTGAVTTVGATWANVVLLTALASAALLGLAVMKWAGKLTGWGRRFSVAVFAGLAAFIAGALPAMLVQQVGLSDPLLAPDPRSSLAIVGAASIVYALLAALVAGGRALEESGNLGTAIAPLETAHNEVVVWSRQVTAWVFLLAGGVSGIALIIAGLTTPLWFLSLIGGILLVLGLTTSRWNITVDHRGLTCTTLFGLGRFAIPATPEATADVTHVRGFSEFLGWGVRVGAAQSVGLIFRNGEAVRVRAAGGRSLTVTTADATTAAALFNTYTARSH